MAKPLTNLIANNRRWATKMEARHPGFFNSLVKQQAPRYMWIGCADSRVPANELVDLAPGELFVHRNVANVVVHSDLNCLSVVQFAIEVLHVEHILVVGHSNCGGVSAALNDVRVGIADNWLRHVQDVRNRHMNWLETLPHHQRVNALCELNVIEQALNVSRTTILQDAWKRGESISVHGWVYGLNNGLLEDLLVTISGEEDRASSYARGVRTVRSCYRAMNKNLRGGARSGEDRAAPRGVRQAQTLSAPPEGAPSVPAQPDTLSPPLLRPGHEAAPTRHDDPAA